MYTKKYISIITLLCLLPTTITAMQTCKETFQVKAFNYITTHQPLIAAVVTGTVGLAAFCIYRWRVLPNFSVIGSGSRPNILQSDGSTIIPHTTRVPTTMNLDSLETAQ